MNTEIQIQRKHFNIMEDRDKCLLKKFIEFRHPTQFSFGAFNLEPCRGLIVALNLTVLPDP